jgi:hypothetical protein
MRMPVQSPDKQVTGTYGSYGDYDARSTFSDARPTAPTSATAPPRPFSPASADVLASAVEEDPSEAEDFGATGVLGSDVIAGASAPQATGSFGPVSADTTPDYGASADDFAAFAAQTTTDSPQLPRRADKKKSGLFGRRKKKQDFSPPEFGADDQPAAWLGLDTDYNAREEGQKIGSWENFSPEQDDFDDGFSWKGGAAEGDLIEDDEYAAAQAARIRRKISETQSTGLGDKELWFVATSAHSVHARGMRTFLADYHEELRGALFINLAALGAGDLYWSMNERASKVHKSSARLTAVARRIAREKNFRAKPFKKGTLQTEAGWALAEGRKALSVTRLTAAGVPFACASSQDVAGRLASENIDEAVDFVISLIREL